MSNNQLMTAEQLKKRIKSRFYRALDYLSIYIFIIIVYGGATIAEYLLFSLLWLLLSEDVQKYPIISLALDYARIGLGLLFISSAFVHGALSTYHQIKLDFRLAKEGEKE